jgi:hypothetical protein
VRSDISLAYQGVQGGHALAQWLLENPNQTWNNQYLIYLSVDDIDKFMFKLDLKGIKYSKFIEPDYDNQVTAIALQTDDKLISKLKLMGT